MTRKSILNKTYLSVFIIFFVLSFMQSANADLFLQIDSDMSDGGYSYSDKSAQAHTVSPFGVVIDSYNAYKYSNSSISFDGNGGCLFLSDSEDWDIFSDLTTDYTIGLWVQHKVHNTIQTYISHFTDSTNYWSIRKYSDNSIKFRIQIGADIPLEITGGIINDNNWHYISLVKKKNEIGLYLDGVQVGYGLLTFQYDITGTLYVGQKGGYFGYLNAYADDFVIAPYNIFNASPKNDNSDSFIIPTSLIAPLLAPTLNTPTIDDSQVHLTWNSISNAVSYKVICKNGADNSVTVSENITQPEFTATNLTNNVQYTFSVIAVNVQEQLSPASNEVTATPVAIPIPEWLNSNGNMYLNTGKLGIGTNTPQTALSVNGSITCKEVVVTMDGWADYVFNPEYSLPSIEQVESFIKTNNHLPDMPSEKDIVNNGLSLSDIVKQQMKKIEELTLYVIQLKNENIELNKRIISLENNNE